MKTFTYITLIFLFCYCDSPKKIHRKKIQDQSVQLIGTRNLTKEVAGSNYIKKATQYFVIAKNDTSNFQPIFVEAIEHGKLTLNLNSSYNIKNPSYANRKSELSQVLSEASNSFDMNSLKTISIGRLVQMGDLAINITNEYSHAFGGSGQIKTTDYKRVADFLLTTELTSDLNKLLEPYALSIKNISIEKAFFSDKAALFQYSKLETDSLLVPDKILDCITWLNLEHN